MSRVLVLRPEPGASATVRRAQERGMEAVAVPLFEIEPLQWSAPEASGFDALLLTSANALRHAGAELRQLRQLPVHAVGETTAEAARDAGFDIASVGSEGVDRLLSSIEPQLKLLHLCGEDRRAPLEAPQQITTVPVYRALAVDDPRLSLRDRDVALVHSPRAGERLAELVSDRATISIAAISPAAAEAAGTGWAAVEAAAEPTDDALLALAARLCNNPPPE